MELEDWTAAEYRRWETNKSEYYKLADFGLQKRIEDEFGVKYFITVYVYDRSRYPTYNADIEYRYGFMPTVNFDLANDNFFNVDMNGKFTVEEVERQFNGLWEYFGKPYYSKWEL
jgi:hypothetical protein